MSMASLSFILFQRASLLLVVAFAVTRIPAVARLWDQGRTWQTALFDSLIFGGMGILATQVDVEWTVNGPIAHGLVGRLPYDAMLIGPTLVATAISGLLGGPWVGLLAGVVVGIWITWQGGYAMPANALIHPLSGVLTGFIAGFFSKERVLAPQRAMFVGMFIPIFHVSLLLIFSNDSTAAIRIVNQIGLPLVMTNSLAIAIFTAIIQSALSEREKLAARETERALRIAEEALPYLRQPLNQETAKMLALLLIEELKIAAVSVTNCTNVLAHVGIGEDHHRPGQMLQMQLARIAIDSGEVQSTHQREVIQCKHPDCPLHSAIMVPLRQSGEVIGLINMYFKRSHPARAVDMELARGLGQLISRQLDAVAAIHMKGLVQDARLRNLQAQVNPHFLFNTLHLISALVRVNPGQARQLVAKLGEFMRHNLRITASSRILLEQEIEHLAAYTEIVKTRFADQLDIEYVIESGIEQVFIPPGTIQPLVENSIKHGMVKSGKKCLIRVDIKKMEHHVHVVVTDNGEGIRGELLQALGKEPLGEDTESGFGLYNVNQRLIGLFGSESALRFENMLEGGCKISFAVPVREMEG